MAPGLIDKLTNFLMPVEEEQQPVEVPHAGDRRAQFRVHSQNPAALKVFVATPAEFDDVKLCADYLKANVVVLINYADVDSAVQQRIGDFLNGLITVTGGACQRVTDTVVLYAPTHVDINKEMYAFSRRK